MNKQLAITFNMGSTLDMLGVVTREVFPYMSQAVNAVGQQVANRWVQEIYRAKLWSGEKDAYAQSVHWQMTGDFSGYVEASYKYAQEIEEGRPARDLKRMLGTSLKVRRTQRGTRFLVIPFRHNIKSMPPALYAQAKALETSSVTGQGIRRSGEIVRLSPKTGMTPFGEKRQRRSPFLSSVTTKQAMMVRKNYYQWGNRIQAGFFGTNPKGKVDIAAGMVKMDTSSGAQKSSAYLTFRIMSEKSDGWVVPQQPGQFIARKVLEEITPKATTFFQQAMALDVKKTS